jgi:hypothetical protein
VRKDEFAKFVLSRFTTGERAAAIVGDLIEGSTGELNFWHDVALTAFALSMRASAGLLAAMGAEFLVRWSYGWSLKAANPISASTGFFVACMMILTLIAVYSAVRWGLIDPVTKAAGALWFFASAGVFLRQIAWVPLISGASIAAIVIALLCTAQGKQALLTILSAGAAVLGATYVIWLLLSPILDSGQRPHSYILFMLFLLTPAASVAASMSWIRRTQLSLSDSAVRLKELR